MKIYEFEWGIYGRRVLVYLAEKGITDLDRVPVDLMSGENRQPAFLELNPAGTVPVLDVRPEAEGIIRQSTSIIEYLEEVYPSPDMIGDTPEARAATRDLIYMINECYIYLTRYSTHSSPAFASSVDQKADAAAAYYDQYLKMIGQIEQVISDGEFLRGDRPTIADCILFASVQYADQLYGEPLPKDHPKLSRFYSRFGRRPRAIVPEFTETMLGMLAPSR